MHILNLDGFKGINKKNFLNDFEDNLEILYRQQNKQQFSDFKFSDFKNAIKLNNIFYMYYLNSLF